MALASSGVSDSEVGHSLQELEHVRALRLALEQLNLLDNHLWLVIIKQFVDQHLASGLDVLFQERRGCHGRMEITQLQCVIGLVCGRTLRLIIQMSCLAESFLEDLSFSLPKILILDHQLLLIGLFTSELLVQEVFEFRLGRAIDEIPCGFEPRTAVLDLALIKVLDEALPLLPEPFRRSRSDS